MHSSMMAFLDWGGAVSLGASALLALIGHAHGKDAHRLEAAVPVERLSGECGNTCTQSSSNLEGPLHSGYKHCT